MKMYDKPQDIRKYLNCELECSCGRTHFVPIKDVCISSGAINSLPSLVKKYGYCHPYLVCDEITYKIAGMKCMELLDASGIDASVHTLTHTGFDEATLGEIVINLPDNCDLMIGCGTGSITDIIRYSSYKLDRPCFTVATGAPMDGFAASIGIMNVNNLKATMKAHNSEVIIGDTDILKTAPYRMTVAGFGDLIGKITCLNDWELSRIINGEHYCEKIVELVKKCVDAILEKAPMIKDKNPEVLGEVMNGLVLTGSAISLYGDSRPASGAEHHMSHFWETIFDQMGVSRSMHGEQVATGTVLVIMLAEEILKIVPDFNKAREFANSYDEDSWEEKIKAVYKASSGEILELEKKAQKNNPDFQLKRIDNMEKNWDAIIRQLSTLPSSDSLKCILEDAGCPCTPRDIGVDKELLKDTLMYCKEVRPRYTIFQMAYDLGILDELSDKIIDRISY